MKQLGHWSVLGSCVWGLAAASAQGNTQLYASKEWKLEKAVLPSVSATDVCVASTDKKVDGVVWTLWFYYDPGHARPPAIGISTDSPSVASGLLVRTDSSSTKHSFVGAKFLESDFGRPTFWFAPRDFETLYKNVKRDSSVKVAYVDGTGATKTLNFSLSGSMSTFEQLSKQCAAGQPEVDGEFYDALDKAKPVSFTGAPSFTIEDAFGDVNAAWAYHQTAQAQSAQLQAVQALMKPLLKQEATALSASGNLTADINAKNAKALKLEQEVDALKLQIQADDAQLKAADADLVKALDELQLKTDALQKTTLNGQPYFDAVDSADADVGFYTSQVQSASSSVASANQQLTTLHAQESAWITKVSSLQNSLQQALVAKSNAQAKLNQFNPVTELQLALNADWTYQNYLTGIQASQNKVTQLQFQLNDVQQRIQQNQKALSQCQQVAGADCSAHVQEATKLKTEQSTAQQDLLWHQNHIFELEQKATSRRHDVEANVEAQRDALVEKVSQTDATYQSVLFDLNNAKQSLNQLQTFTIPQADQALQAAKSQLSSSQFQLNQSQKKLSQAQKALALWKQASGYDQIVADYASAQSDVDGLQALADAIEHSLKTNQDAAAKKSIQASKLHAEVAQLVMDLAANNQALVAIQAKLVPLKQQADGFDLAFQQADASFKNEAVEFRSKLSALAPQPSPRMLQAVDEPFYPWMRLR